MSVMMRMNSFLISKYNNTDTVRKLNTKERNLIKKAFHHADEGGKGYLLPFDIKVASMFLFGHKLCKDEVNQMLLKHGTLLPLDQKGLTLAQFEEAMIPKFAALEEDDEIRSTFKAFDKNCRGFLKLEDVKSAFQQVCPHFPEHNIELAFKEIDRDGDGRISYKDFDFMMKFNNLM
ncbi:EF-hand calcium-binding domain-containing protein 11 isoform X1 [Biomphalaria glabrata]|nr:EF-hand calcium-binding domain-containing protein 11 isoform X1 [Biomphalaria glabrata]